MIIAAHAGIQTLSCVNSDSRSRRRWPVRNDRQNSITNFWETARERLAAYFPARVAFQFPPELMFPSIALPLTRPVYKEPPALKVTSLPLSLPFAI
jgi:hypothetical protein